VTLAGDLPQEVRRAGQSLRWTLRTGQARNADRRARAVWNISLSTVNLRPEDAGGRADSQNR
jgi:hypothetical protein